MEKDLTLLEKYISRADALSWRIIDGEAVILSGGKYLHILNRVATQIWESADGKTRLRDIVSRICERFEVDWDTAQHDVMIFIPQLQTKELIIITQDKDEELDG